jgi:HK97 family phage major capsid protein
VDAFEADKTAHETAKQTLSADIEHLETELADLERQAPATKTPEKREKVRGDVHMETQINIRSLPMGRRAFDALPMEQRQAIVAQPEVQEFLSKMRGMKGQNRAVTGAELTIPVVFLDLISENMYRYSKLLNRVRVRNVRGEARQTIAGIVPEAVWTEMCGAINELTFVFGQVTLDGYKVAGFIPVCNSMLEDSDIELASSIVEMLSESVGLAEDKAILYGKGAASKMPLGIVTRLAQTSQPSDYPANAPAWVDLHTTNILKIGGSGVTGAEFWAQLMAATGATHTKYSRGNLFWAMNSKTYTTLKSKVITFTATGDIASNIFGVLPIITGDVDILEFMPDGDIVRRPVPVVPALRHDH